ncbi:MAG TPA: hypothetical protein VG674_19885 [Amycolatopsis sp.]|nr:hypothetical protein [Amycolatopsis sp.]
MEIADLAGRIRDHRFDGWTDTAIADEIQKFFDGDGIGSIGTAVDALRAVATALAETDRTLHDQLTKLGVEWQSQAGGAAGQVFTEQAGFSQDATRKVSHTAELLFAQGEAFNRTKFKLPNPDTLLKGAGGYNLGDHLLSLIGFETDHAEAVDAAQNSRSQALEALNAYAQLSGENLLQSEPLNQPQSLSMTPPDSSQGALDLAGSAVDVTPDGSVAPASASVRSRQVDPPAAQPVSQHTEPPTPAYGVRAQGAPGGAYPAPAGAVVVTPPAGGRPPAGPTPAVAQRPVPAGWETPPGQQGPPARAGFGGPASPGAPGGSAGPGRGFVNPHGNPSDSGAPGGRGPGGATPGGGGIGARPEGVFGGAPAGGTGGGDPTLGRGGMVGSGPQPPLVPEGGAGVPPVAKPGASPGEIGAGAAALGAGAGASALAGDRERQGRGFGGPAKGPVSPLPVELPEEEAIALRKTEQVAPEPPPGDPKFLGPAATQDGDDGLHVRRFGVDDKDLFTDDRLVSDDVIGDDA